jgi:hypothetical protein
VGEVDPLGDEEVVCDKENPVCEVAFVTEEDDVFATAVLDVVAK